ncbi:MAG: tetratricopeptide repeat protein, partial [Gemmatimonadales bacterium]
DWDASEREFQRAIALNPSYAFAHDQYGGVLSFMGQLDSSIAEGRRAIALDPLSPSILWDATTPHAYRRDVAAVRELAQKAADLDPTAFFPSMVEGWADLGAGNVRDAIPRLEKAAAMEAPPFATAILAYAYGASGDRARAMSALEALKRKSKDGQVAPFNLALVYLGLGDRERALDNLERAYASDSQFMVWLSGDHLYDPLRSEPRFIALMKKLNFAQ